MTNHSRLRIRLEDKWPHPAAPSVALPLLLSHIIPQSCLMLREHKASSLPPSLPPCGPVFLLPSQVSMARDRHVRGVRAEVVKPRGLAPHLSVFFPTLVKGD